MCRGSWGLFKRNGEKMNIINKRIEISDEMSDKLLDKDSCW